MPHPQEQPEALRLADSITASGSFTPLAELDAAAAELRRLHALCADGWQPIADAPRDRTVLVGYWNSHGNWRTLRASFYAKGELELSDDYPDDGDGFAPEGWYEEAYTHETIMPLEQEPVMFHALPSPPDATKEGL